MLRQPGKGILRSRLKTFTEVGWQRANVFQTFEKRLEGKKVVHKSTLSEKETLG